jgi:hypothetical protein
MENPAVVVKITINQPSGAESWASTPEGAVMYHVVSEILLSYAPNIEINIVKPEGATLYETFVYYSSREIYEEARNRCLAAEPTFIQNRDAYYQEIGGSAVQEVTFL